MDDKALTAKLLAGDVAGLGNAPALYRRLFTLQVIRVVVAAAQRYWAWGSSDIFLFRLSPAIGSLRMTAEALALVTLFWDDDALADEWFMIKEPSEGQAFFKKTQPNVKDVLKKHDVDKTYGIASGVGQHVRMSGNGDRIAGIMTTQLWSSAAPPIGNRLTRTRCGSIVKMHPVSNESFAPGNSAINRAAMCAGWRLVGPRKSTTDGRDLCRSASSVPKSVSAETTTRASNSARSRMTASSAS